MQGYEVITLIIAGIAIVTGILLISSPATLIKAGELFNRVYNVESIVYTKRIPFGFLYLIAGATFLYILW
jgi:hypothetical protein